MATQTPSPPSSPPHPKSSSNAQDYYYFVVTIAIVVIMLVVSNVIAVACCSPCSLIQIIRSRFHFRSSRGISVVSDRSQEIIPVCKYREEQAFDSECSVCLTGFMDGEEVRQLPRCKHSFHAPCIDMWLYSHSNCPLCRAFVEGMPLAPPPRCPGTVASREESRQQRGYAESGDMARIVGILV